MKTKITATELAKSLSDVLNRVRYRGERFIIERSGEPVATLIPTSPVLGITLRDLVARLGDMSMPGDGFAEDLEAVQASQPKVTAPAWPS